MPQEKLPSPGLWQLFPWADFRDDPYWLDTYELGQRVADTFESTTAEDDIVFWAQLARMPEIERTCSQL